MARVAAATPKINWVWRRHTQILGKILYFLAKLQVSRSKSHYILNNFSSASVNFKLQNFARFARDSSNKTFLSLFVRKPEVNIIGLQTRHFIFLYYAKQFRFVLYVQKTLTFFYKFIFYLPVFIWRVYY